MLRANSNSRFLRNASPVPQASTCTEWSTTRSTGTSGSTFAADFPARAMAARMAARSTMSGTPVKSWASTRETTKGISSTRSAWGCQAASARTSFSWMRVPSRFRTSDSRTTRIDTGSREMRPKPLASSAGSEKKRPVRPAPRGKLERMPSGSVMVGAS